MVHDPAGHALRGCRDARCGRWPRGHRRHRQRRSSWPYPWCGPGHAPSRLPRRLGPGLPERARRRAGRAGCLRRRSLPGIERAVWPAAGQGPQRWPAPEHRRRWRCRPRGTRRPGCPRSPLRHGSGAAAGKRPRQRQARGPRLGWRARRRTRPASGPAVGTVAGWPGTGHPARLGSCSCTSACRPGSGVNAGTEVLGVVAGLVRVALPDPGHRLLQQVAQPQE